MCNEHALQEVGALFAMFDHPLEGTASTYSKFFFFRTKLTWQGTVNIFTK